MRHALWPIFVVIIAVTGFNYNTFGQSFQSSPYSPTPFLRRENADFSSLYPSNSVEQRNPLLTRFPSLNNEASPKRDIPNLQAGYIYYSGSNWRVGYFTVDYLLPFRLTENSIIFAAAHSEIQTGATHLNRRSDEKVFLSGGGGYRKIIGDKTIFGINGFYDTAKFANKWLSSGGAGLEFATLVTGQDALDMQFNWYGDVAEGVLLNQYRNGLANFDLQVGYSHQLFSNGPDLRLFGTAYKFDDNAGVFGWQTGGELKSPNGVISIKGETAADPVNGSYQSVSAFLNLGFEIDQLFRGKNPFVMPEPIFASPRNMNRLTNKVTRNYRNTTHGLQTAGFNVNDHTRVVKIVNNTGTSQTVYVKFQPSTGPPWGDKGQYKKEDFVYEGSPWKLDSKGILYAQLGKNNEDDTIVLNFNKPNADVYNSAIPMTISMGASDGCAFTQAEMTLHDNWSDGVWHDWYNISLINGFNYPVKIDTPYPDTPDPFTPDNPYRCVKTIQAKTLLGNSGNIGVYGVGNDQCCASCSPPCCSEWNAQGIDIAKEAHPTYQNVPANCAEGKPYSPCPANPQPPQKGSYCDPRPRCHMDAWHSLATGNVFTVTFNSK